MSIEYPNEELEFRMAWSACGGRLTALHCVREYLEAAAYKSFFNGNDHEAKVLRGIVQTISKDMEKVQQELRGFIEEDSRRRPKV